VDAPVSFSGEVSAGEGLYLSLEGSANAGGSAELVPKIGGGWGISSKQSPSIMFLKWNGLSEEIKEDKKTSE
jgi:hypothetical protein